jgi:hypothetical protein
MLDLSSGEPVIPAGFFHQLRQRRSPLMTSIVTVGAYNPATAAVWAERTGLRMDVPESEPANGFVATLTVGHALFQVIGHFTTGRAEINDDRVFKGALARIWPPREDTIDWPPADTAFDDEWLRILAASVQ